MIFKGGFTRGNALGNVFSLEDSNATIPFHKGAVFLYFSSENPRTIGLTERPAMKAKVAYHSTAKPLVKAIAQKCPEIISESKLHFCSFNLFLLH